MSEKYAPELLGKSPASKAKILEGFFVIRCIKDALTAGCYAADTSKAKESIESQAKKIKLIEDKLADRDWIEGDTPSLADLFLMEVVD